MANETELKARMESIEETRKITNAMYLISSSKMKRAKQRLADTEPYFFTLQNAVARLLRHVPDIENQYLEKEDPSRNSEKTGILVITADKGMAGAYNQNVLKVAQETIRQREEAGAEKPALYVVGEIGRAYFEQRRIPFDSQFHYTIQKPTMHRARVIAQTLLSQYRACALTEVLIIYTQMKNAMESEAKLQQLLPLHRAHFDQPGLSSYGEEMTYLPSPEAALESIVPNYVAGYIYSALVEAYSSEQNARMNAMRSATESADDMIRSLRISCNRIRQSSITQEITEVAGGARALKEENR